jgi:hypothetical protein
VLVEKLVVPQLAKRYPAFFVTQRLFKVLSEYTGLFSVSRVSVNVDDFTSANPNSAIRRSQGLEGFATAVVSAEVSVHADNYHRSLSSARPSSAIDRSQGLEGFATSVFSVVSVHADNHHPSLCSTSMSSLDAFFSCPQEPAPGPHPESAEHLNSVSLVIMSIAWDYVSELRPPTGLFFIPLVSAMYECEEPWWNYVDRGNWLSTRALWQSYQQSYSIKSGGTWRKKWIWPSKYLCSYFEVIFTCRKILRHGVDDSTSPPKEGVLRNFIILKNPSPRQGLNLRTLGPVSNTLTITPPRRHSMPLISILMLPSSTPVSPYLSLPFRFYIFF